LLEFKTCLLLKFARINNLLKNRRKKKQKETERKQNLEKQKKTDRNLPEGS
jgi:hypothetical protein